MNRVAALSVRQRIAAAACACVALAVVLVAAREGAVPLVEDEPTTFVSGVEVVAGDPFAFEAGSAEEFADRGARGVEHVLYELSPGGVEATARRTAGFEEEIAAAAEAEGIEPSTLEALVFLESAGRPDVSAGPTPESAAGLGQILPQTAEDLLGMSVDLERSSALTRAIGRAEERAGVGSSKARGRVARLLEQRRAVDDRFEPEAALAGAARYLALGEERFGREDLGATSYHMGIGNLEGVIEAYLDPRPPAETTAATVDEYGLSYAQLYFDSTAAERPRAHALLEGLGDDSRHYSFKLDAAREIMRLYREDPDELRRRIELHDERASSEAVLHPPDETEAFTDPEALEEAYDDGELVRLRERPRRLGYRIDDGMGELADELDADPSLYRGLRPEALAAIVYIVREVRELTGEPTVLTLTSTVHDAAYDGLLLDPGSGEEYSLHTTGFAFDIARELSRPEEQALGTVLTRLETLAVTASSREPAAYQVTVGSDAARLVAD